MSDVVPGHVITAFDPASVPTETATTWDLRPQPAGIAWDYGWIIGSVVYSRAPITASWSARLREDLQVPGARISRPLRSSDGRFVVGKWRAQSLIDGHPYLRPDETVALALRLSDALTDADMPSGLERNDPWAQAEREAFAYCDERFGPLDLPVQVGHYDLLATTVFAETHAPGITDVVPYDQPRPKMMTAAQAIADALIIQAEVGVDYGLIERFAHIPDLDQLLLRAVKFRELANQLQDNPNSLTSSNVSRVWEALLSKTVP